MKITLLLFMYYCSTCVMCLQCYWNTECSYKYFSSKTLYNSVRGDIRDSIIKITPNHRPVLDIGLSLTAKLKLSSLPMKRNIDADSQIISRYWTPKCEPLSIWSIIRHGQRNPGIDFARQMKKALSLKDLIIESFERNNSSICAQDIENLQNWTVPKDMLTNVRYLTDQGYQEMLGIGQRIRKVFPDLVNNLEGGTYKFQSAYGHWLVNSMKAFLDGLTAGNNDKIIEEINDDSDIIAPYSICGKYQRDVKNNPQTYAEAVKYKESADFKATKDRIQTRTGINYNLSNDNITTLYDLCRYTWSGLNKYSPWCSIFSQIDLEVLEYIGDLRHYYRSSYGIPTNTKYAEPLLWDLLKSFEDSKQGEGKKITSYSAHETMTDMILTALGLFKDDLPLTGKEKNPDRKLRTSIISCFSTNIMAVLLRCTTDNFPEYKVIFYLNEEPLTALCDDGVCSWEQFENLLKPFVNATVDPEYCEFKTDRY